MVSDKCVYICRKRQTHFYTNDTYINTLLLLIRCLLPRHKRLFQNVIYKLRKIIHVHNTKIYTSEIRNFSWKKVTYTNKDNLDNKMLKQARILNIHNSDRKNNVDNRTSIFRQSSRNMNGKKVNLTKTLQGNSHTCAFILFSECQMLTKI